MAIKKKGQYARVNIDNNNDNNSGNNIDNNIDNDNDNDIDNDIENNKKFVGEGEVEEEYGKKMIWGIETAVVAYQLFMIDKLNKALFPGEYESNEEMKKISEFLKGDNNVIINDYRIFGKSYLDEGVEIGVSNDIIVKNTIKEESLGDAKKLLSDMKKFYDKNKNTGNEIRNKQCELMSALCDPDDQPNMLLCVDKSILGDKIYEVISLEPVIGNEPTEEDKKKYTEKEIQQIKSYKTILLERVLVEAQYTKLIKENKDEEAEKLIDRISKLDEKIVRTRNRLKLVDDKKPKENRMPLFIKDKKMFAVVLGQREALKNGWKPVKESIVLENFFLMIEELAEKDSKEFEIDKKRNSYTKAYYANKKKETIEKLRALKNKIVKKLSDTSFDAKTDIIEDINDFVDELPEDTRKTLSWYKNRGKISLLAEELNENRTDTLKAKEILAIKGGKRAEKLVDLQLKAFNMSSREDEFDIKVNEQCWRIIGEMETDDKEKIYSELIEEKGRIFDQLLEEATRQRDDLSDSFLTALQKEKFGSFESNNTDTIVKKMAARLAAAARPDLIEKLDVIDYCTGQLKEKYVIDRDNKIENEILKTRLEDNQNGALYSGFNNIKNFDPELKDVRLVIDDRYQNDRIALVVSNEAKEREIGKIINLNLKVSLIQKHLLESAVRYNQYYNKIKGVCSDLGSLFKNGRNADLKAACDAMLEFKKLSSDQSLNDSKNMIVKLYSATLTLRDNYNNRAFNGNLTEQQKKIKTIVSDIFEDVERDFDYVRSTISEARIVPNFANIKFSRLTKDIMDRVNNTYIGTQSAEDYYKKNNYYLQALEVVKNKAAKSLTDMNANKWGNSWQFNNLKESLIAVTKLSNMSTPFQVLKAIKNVESNADIYVDKSDNQIHPFGEPKRTTVARTLQHFCEELRWPGEAIDGRFSVESYFSGFPGYMNVNESLYEQQIRFKEVDEKMAFERMENAKVWKSDFLGSQVKNFAKIAKIINPNMDDPEQVLEALQPKVQAALQPQAQAAGRAQPQVQAEGQPQPQAQAAAKPIPVYVYGKNKENDKKLLAARLKIFGNINNDSSVREMMVSLQKLDETAKNVYKANKGVIARVDRNLAIEMGIEVKANEETVNVKANDIVKYVNTVSKGIQNIEISKKELDKSLKSFDESRAKHLNKVLVNNYDSFSNTDDEKRIPNLRKPAKNNVK